MTEQKPRGRFAALSGWVPKASLSLALPGLLLAGPGHCSDGTRAKAARAEVWLDDTSSVDTADRRKAIQAIITALPGLSEKNRLTEWKFFGFAENPWEEDAFYGFKIAPFQPPPCDGEAKANVEIVIFKRPTEHLRAKERCDQKQANARAAYARDLANSYAAAAAALDSHGQGRAHCTSIVDLLTRISRDSDPGLAVIVSDGRETCRRDFPKIDPPKHKAVIFVLTGWSAGLQKGGPTAVQRFDAMAAILTKAAPWLKIIPPWSIDDGSFDYRVPE
jgi:hypothetical protein